MELTEEGVTAHSTIIIFQCLKDKNKGAVLLYDFLAFWAKFCPLKIDMLKSVWDAVTKYQALSGLNSRHLFLTVLRLQVQDQGDGTFSP